MYALLHISGQYRRAFVGHYPSIPEALKAIPREVLFWDHDVENDAADAFAADGELYAIEREAL